MMHWCIEFVAKASVLWVYQNECDWDYCMNYIILWWLLGGDVLSVNGIVVPNAERNRQPAERRER